jgi:cold shock CspA family protein
MFHANPSCRLPRVLECPHCAGQMNLSGRGKAPGVVTYFCGRCVPLLRIKELWLGQVVRTGNLGFGFVQLRGPSELGGVHFRVSDFAAVGREPVAAAPRVGDQVLVLLDDDAQHARRVWRVPVTAGAPHNGQAAPRAAGNGTGKEKNQGRRTGTVTRVVTEDWGFITEVVTGRELFVHRRELRGGVRLVPGQRVTYLPAQTPKGLRACEVEGA